MKILIFLLLSIALFNHATCQDEYVQLTEDEYTQDQAAQDSFNLGWNLLVQDAIAKGLFSADMTWSDIEPSCVFKKSIEGGTRYEFLGNAVNQNGDACRYLIFVNYTSGSPVFNYYSYFYQDKFASKSADDNILYVEDRNQDDSTAAPAIVTEELAPQEEVENFEVPEVEVLEEENQVEVTEEENSGEQAEENAEVEVEVEIEANANPLEGYLPIDLASLDIYPQGVSARDDGLKLIIENLVKFGQITGTEEDWKLDETLKAYLQVADGGIRFYFAVSIEREVNEFTLNAAVEYYVFNDADGVNHLEAYNLGDQWASAYSVPN